MSKKAAMNASFPSFSLPKGAFILFMMQLFSTLSFSVMFSSLALYSTDTLHLKSSEASTLTATFMAFNFVLHILGGYMGGRLFSFRSLFALGMLLLTAGSVLISFPAISVFYWGLAIFLAGTGLNVTCINCMITQLFAPEDKSRETAFLLNYSAMNIGFLIGFSLSGYFHLDKEYHLLFLLASIGNIIAFLITLSSWQLLKDKGSIYESRSPSEQKKMQIIGAIIVFCLILGLHYSFFYANLTNKFILAFGIAMGVFIVLLAYQQPSLSDRKRLLAFLILCCAGVIYFTLDQLLPIGLMLFINHNVNLFVFGIHLAPQWLQNINPIIIVLCAPLFSLVFKKLRSKHYIISVPIQFSLALLLVGSGFYFLPVGIKFANVYGYSNIIWIVFCLILQSIGEIFIMPIGYAMIGELIPIKLQGMMMGAWLMVSGVAAPIANYFSLEGMGNQNSSDPLLTNPHYAHAFATVASCAVLAGCILLLLVKVLNKMIHSHEKILPHSAEKAH